MSVEILGGVNAPKDASGVRLVLLVTTPPVEVSRARQLHFNGCFNLLELSERGLGGQQSIQGIFSRVRMPYWRTSRCPC